MSWIFVDEDKFYLHEGETLLQGLQRVGYTPNFECTQGYCGSCKIKITQIQGDSTHSLPPLCMLQEDEVLACCCLVRGTIAIHQDCLMPSVVA